MLLPQHYLQQYPQVETLTAALLPYCYASLLQHSVGVGTAQKRLLHIVHHWYGLEAWSLWVPICQQHCGEA